MNHYRTKQDYYSKKAKSKSLRSRSFFKLQEINQKYKFITNQDIVLDLGATPGGWSMYLKAFVKEIVAVDILPMKPIERVQFIQTDIDVLEKIPKKFSIILSDMAPNMSGISIIDQMKSYELAEKAFLTAENFGLFGYTLLVKIFQSPEAHLFKNKLQKLFKEVKIIKPTSSRKQSSEIYILAIQRLITDLVN